MKRICAVLLQLAVGTGLVRAESTNPSALFPFVLPWDDATPGIANVGEWLDQPAGKNGFVVARDGHFYTGNKRIRFLGVNLVAPAAFPQHADADKIAARMAKFGINCVRFHHMDAGGWSPLLEGNRLNPDALDRLDYLIAQLKRHGIYANLNLLVLRNFGIEHMDVKDQHVIGFFDPKLLDLQKKYARQLLTHTNAYTGLPYTRDPAVAIVEINNENGLIHAWLGGVVDRLPEIFRTELRQQWNDWLRARYGTTAKLRAGWRVRDEPLGEEMLTGPWILEQHAGALASVTNGQVTVTATAPEGWHVQYNHPALPVKLDQLYTLTFRAKADKPCEVSVTLMQAHEPWHDLGLAARAKLTTEWQTFRFSFPASQTDTNARVNFGDLGRRLGSVWFDAVSCRPGGTSGLNGGERVEDGTVPIANKSSPGTVETQRDWMRFLWETEDHYWQAMDRFVKDDLQVHAVVIGTIVGCSPPNLQAKFDAVDAHAYWQHPHFPGKAWDQDNWIVPNKTMVNELGGVLPGLALKRVAGKPFCVTEYNHSAPNTFGCEGFLLLAAYGALQDWDAIFAFAYSHRGGDWDARHITGFFDIDQHPTKMATLLPAAAMFLRGDVQPADELVTVPLNREKELALLPQSHAWGLVDAGSVGVSPETTLQKRVAMQTGGSVTPNAQRPTLHALPELHWERGVVTVNAPKSKAVIGFTGGKQFDLGGLMIEPGATRQDGWSAITVTEMRPKHWLVTATGYAENTGMKWKSAAHDSVGRNWGSAPSLVEGVPAAITFPTKVRAWALDERGQRGVEFPVEGAVVKIEPAFKTLWYEVEAR